ncbi:LysR family transcriptional regulator [Pseudonocardia lacus]|uniref:LysR family transcriptional regulator n=1 Tax=Pseudonocardia lacus TaxID=2835865 RepID=UPI001BDBF882|nr:LysR family transcriptional regulator [Pseudonocardia lacus]
MRYDLVDLRLFLHVVAEGSITAGAARMHLSLPSASGRVRALEHHCGAELLVRGRRGVRPTPAGAALARHAREVLARAARMESAVASYARPGAAALRLLAGSSATHRLVPEALAGFLAAHPDVDVVAAERRSARIVELLAAGEADLGVVLDEVALSAGVEAEPLGDDSLVVVGQAGGLLHGRAALTFAEVAEHPLVGLGADVPLQRSIEDHLGQHAPAPRYRAVTATIGTVVGLAAAGVGLAVLPRRAVEDDPRLDVCELHEPWATRGMSLCRGATDRAVSPAAEALAESLRAAARPRAS